MLNVKSGSSAPHGWKCDRSSDKKCAEICDNILRQVDRINGMLNMEMAQFRTFQMTNKAIPTENDCKRSRCDVLKQLNDYFSCITFDTNQTQIKMEMKGIIQNLQMLRNSKEETCSLPDDSCPTEIEQLSRWNKMWLLQVIMTCLQKHICPS